jgi:hypothetical protein
MVSPVFASEILKDKNTKIEFGKKNRVLAEQIQEMVEPAKLNIKRKTGLDQKKLIYIILFENSAEFKKATGTNNLSVQGVAFSQENLILINYENIFKQSTSDIQHLLEHEIAHLVMGNYIAHDSAKHLPRWFNEGIAQWVSEGANELFSASYQNSLQSAFLNKQLIPFASLIYSFPADPSGFILAYAQSLSLVEYLEEQFGEKKLIAFIQLLTQENDFFKAFAQIYNLPFEKVESDWFNTKKRTTYTLDYYFATHINNFIDSLVGITFIIVFITLYIRNRIKKKRVKEPDNTDNIIDE